MTPADLIRQWQAQQEATRRAYEADPFAGTHALNDNDKARERMAARRAERNRP
jgi:hypothetical protein